MVVSYTLKLIITSIRRFTELPDDNGGADIDKVTVYNLVDGTPHCKDHGAMNKVSEFGYWRCIHSWKCRAGCREVQRETSV